MKNKEIEEYRTLLKEIAQIKNKPYKDIEYMTDWEIIDDALKYGIEKKTQEYNKAIKELNDKSKKNATLNLLKQIVKK